MNYGNGELNNSNNNITSEENMLQTDSLTNVNDSNVLNNSLDNQDKANEKQSSKNSKSMFICFIISTLFCIFIMAFFIIDYRRSLAMSDVNNPMPRSADMLLIRILLSEGILLLASITGIILAKKNRKFISTYGIVFGFVHVFSLFVNYTMGLNILIGIYMIIASFINRKKEHTNNPDQKMAPIVLIIAIAIGISFVLGKALNFTSIAISLNRINKDEQARVKVEEDDDVQYEEQQKEEMQTLPDPDEENDDTQYEKPQQEETETSKDSDEDESNIYKLDYYDGSYSHERFIPGHSIDIYLDGKDDNNNVIFTLFIKNLRLISVDSLNCSGQTTSKYDYCLNIEVSDEVKSLLNKSKSLNGYSFELVPVDSGRTFVRESSATIDDKARNLVEKNTTIRSY